MGDPLRNRAERLDPVQPSAPDHEEVSVPACLDERLDGVRIDSDRAELGGACVVDLPALS